jgi:hypothetical protein
VAKHASAGIGDAFRVGDADDEALVAGEQFGSGCPWPSR